MAPLSLRGEHLYRRLSGGILEGVDSSRVRAAVLRAVDAFNPADADLCQARGRQRVVAVDQDRTVALAQDAAVDRAAVDEQVRQDFGEMEGGEFVHQWI